MSATKHIFYYNIRVYVILLNPIVIGGGILPLLCFAYLPVLIFMRVKKYVASLG